MSTATLGACVGKAYVQGSTGECLVFDTEEADYFILLTPKGARFRRHRKHIMWRKQATKS